MIIKLKCWKCNYVYDPEDAPIKSVLVDSIRYWKHFEHFPICPECGCDEAEEFKQLSEECSSEDCYGDCENCETKKRLDEKEGEDE